MRFSPNEAQATKLRKLEEVTNLKLGQCIQLLELTNWDLQKAIKLHMTIQETKKATVSVVFDSNMILVVYVEMAKDLKHSGMHQLEIELNKKIYTTGWVESLGRPSFRSTFEFKHIGKGRFLRMALWHRRTFTPNKKVAEVRFDLAKIHDSNKKGLSKFQGWVPMPYKERIGASLYVNMELRTLNGNAEAIVGDKSIRKKSSKIKVDDPEVKPLRNSSDSEATSETDGCDKLTSHQHPVESDFVEFKETNSEDMPDSHTDNWGCIPATSSNDIKKSTSQGSQGSKQKDDPMIKSNLSKKLGRGKKSSKKEKSRNSAFGSSEVFISSLNVDEDPFAEFNDVKFTDTEVQKLENETPDKFLDEMHMDSHQITVPLNPTSGGSSPSQLITPLTSITETSDTGILETDFQNIESSEAIVDALLDRFYSEDSSKSSPSIPSPVFPEATVKKTASPKATTNSKPKKIEQKKKEFPTKNSNDSMFPDVAKISGEISSPGLRGT